MRTMTNGLHGHFFNMNDLLVKIRASVITITESKIALTESNFT